ncbi:MAG: PP2C family protein-serine/threonine phosphatase, partial [Chloroflexota bacterium]
SFNAVLSQRYYSPSKFLRKLDQVLTPYAQSSRQNCALSYVEFDNYQLNIANAGGVPPYIRRKNGGVEWPEVNGFALGQGLGDKGYEHVSVPVSAGDLVILTSDGLIETKNEVGVMFGFDRFKEAIARGPTDDAQSLLDHLLNEISMFATELDLDDDLVLVVGQVKGWLVD